MILCIISRPGWWIACVDTRDGIKRFVAANVTEGDEVGRWVVAETKGNK